MRGVDVCCVLLKLMPDSLCVMALLALAVDRLGETGDIEA